MNAHVFGGTSSPSCWNYAHRLTAIDNEDKFGKEAAVTLEKNFYVDDLFKSVNTIKDATSIIHNVITMFAAGGFNLTKFTSNRKEILLSIPEEKRRKGVKDQDLSSGEIPQERALGIIWKIEEDTLGFQLQLLKKPLTRRGLLSVLSSVYDPLGIAGPFLLEGRSIIQELCKNDLKWDEKIPQDITSQWNRWLNRLQGLNKLSIPRCYTPEEFGKISHYSLHHFF